MKENSYEETREENEEKVDIQELFFKYAIHWPWFVASVVICLIGAWFYLHYTTPVYNISASVIIKDDKKGGTAGTLTGLEDMGLGSLMSSSQNIDNEIEVLRSKTIIKEVISSLNLYTSYKDNDEFPSKDLYRNTPVQVILTPQEAEKLHKPAIIKMKLEPQGSLDVTVNIGDDVEYIKHFDKLPAVLPTSEGTFSFIGTAVSDTINEEKTAKEEIHNITATITQPMKVAKAYLEAMTVEPTSKTTSVAVISLKNSNQLRGQDFINKLLEMYNRNTNNDKNEIAQKTAEFVNDRIEIINGELGSTETKLESFKRNAGLTDLKNDAQLALTGNAEYEKKRVENGTQIRLVRGLADYIADPTRAGDVLPADITLADVGLATQIDRYNTLVLERRRLLRTSTENNPAIINLETSIRAMGANIQTTINATLRNLAITKSDLDREGNRFSQRITNAPGQEREFVSISRQQEIKAGLYLMLLQKREENAITLAATANNAKIIDEAIADEIPVSPKGKLIYLIALVLGIGIPVGAIYMIGLTQFKIEGRADVEKLTTAPIIGDIPLTDEKERQGSIAVFENQNNLMSETFRNIRTNVQFMLQGGKKVVLVTSTVSGEGKSFVSSNLAISLSLLNKKVVIVGLDIRKPGLNKVFSLSHRERGITQYLANPTGTDLMSMVQQSTVSENLYILPGGTVPPNPTELLARQGLDDAINLLKEQFDYVVLDTAPIGMVTDTQLIGRVADISIYVCRADYTHKVEYTLINELKESNKLPNLTTVINGLDMKKKKYGYYYGYGKYGKYYGYGKRYGYGYGYGQTGEKGEKGEKGQHKETEK